MLQILNSPVRFLIACIAVLTFGPAAALPADAERGPSARIDNARIFPFFAAGGGWESTIILINVFESEIGYRISFRGGNGQPAQISFRAPDNRIMLTDTVQGELGDDASATIAPPGYGTAADGLGGSRL